MKKLIGLLIPVLVACEPPIPQDNYDIGTCFDVRNNTFGVSDFKVGKVGKYAIPFASLDFGRNLGVGNSYSDSIGFIEFKEDGTGNIELTEQDTIHSRVDFTYNFGRRDHNTTEVFIEFEDSNFKTYSKTPPAEIFNYVRVGQSLWKYEVSMSKYSGRFVWFANKIMK